MGYIDDVGFNNNFIKLYTQAFEFNELQFNLSSGETSESRLTRSNIYQRRGNNNTKI